MIGPGESIAGPFPRPVKTEEEQMAGKTTAEWETVQEEPRTRVSLDQEDDEFIGFYEGTEHIVDPNPDKDGEYNEWDQYNFIGISPSELDGERVAINAGAHLRRALDQIEPMKYIVRIRRGKTVPVKNQPSPMITFKVDRKLA
jgi:hypothetical protein